MYQTEKYRLNLIETSDAFSPDALNDSTRKIDAALSAHETAVAAQADDLDRRIQVFEAKKFVYGTYVNNLQTSFSVTLGFKPKLVFIHWISPFTGLSAVVTEDYPNSGDLLKLTEDGFESCTVTSGTYYPGRYYYIALG